MTLRTGKYAGQSDHDAGNRRRDIREPVIGALWMIDNRTSTVFRCRCVDVSENGMCLRVPMGYGVSEGQRYELTSHLPGQSAPPGLGLMVSRRAEIVRTRIVSNDDEYDVEVGVKLSERRTARVNNINPMSATA